MSKHQTDTGISGTTCTINSPRRRRGRPPGRVSGSARDIARYLGVSHATIVRRHKIARVSAGATALLESAGVNAQLDYLAVYKASRTAMADEYFSRCHIDDALPTDEDFARAELAAARTHVEAKREARRRASAKRQARQEASREPGSRS